MSNTETASDTNNQFQLDFSAQLDGARGGLTFDPSFDETRLNGQHRRVFDVMRFRTWRSLSEISALTGDPEASVSARLRDFRKLKFGGWCVERQRRGDPETGWWEYRLLPHEGAEIGCACVVCVVRRVRKSGEG